MALSLAEQIAALPPDEQEAAIAELDPEELQWDWNFWGRPEQHAPDGNWAIWLYMAGRGAGKTRAASEWVRDKVARSPFPIRVGLVARTASDVRDTLVEGDSGIMTVTPPSELPEYKPAIRRLVWPNGSIGQCYSAEEGDQLRGPQFDIAWADEAAAWRQTEDSAGMTAWDNLRFATRLGPTPQICATTTPKRVKLMRELIKESEEKGTVVLTRGKTSDNVGNLAASYLEVIYGKYAGTRTARQELEGEMLEAVEGALWTQETLDATRATAIALGLPLKVVGVDPTVAERPNDDCGIVVVGATNERDLYRRQAWVLEDATIHGKPDVWAQRVVDTARKWGAPVVAETNQGGALVRNAINAIDPGVPVIEVWSKQGKMLRAEPASLAYEQGRVHHVGFLAELETQMTTWIPGETKGSPDRVDALVHALTALLIKPPKGFGGGPVRSMSPAARRIPIQRGAAASGRARGRQRFTPGRRVA